MTAPNETVNGDDELRSIADVRRGPPLVGRLRRLLLVGGIASSLAGAFLYAGGWLSPHQLTPARFIDTFEQVNGLHPGFRRNHAKGLGVTGIFDSNGQGAPLSKATVFQSGRVRVVGRFALAGGKPYAADSVENVRSMALQFLLPDGEEWRTGMNDIPVFAVSTPQAFRDQLIASAPDPATGKPDPAKMKAFFDQHPESARAIQRIKSQAPTWGFADSTYNSLNAFVLVDAAGRSRPVRWSMVPEHRVLPAAMPRGENAPNFLFDALIAQLHREPLRWHLVMTIGQTGDPTNDATFEWPPDRETVDVGTLTIDHAESEENSPVRTINFDPLVLPRGINGSDDPLLSARSATYSQSFRRRVGEPASSSAVTPIEVGR
jgi:catalase